MLAMALTLGFSLAGCASAPPPTVRVKDTKAQVAIVHQPKLGKGILEVKRMAITPFTGSDAVIMSMTYYFAGVSVAVVDKAFNDTRSLIAARLRDINANQTTLRAYPGGTDNTVVSITAQKLADGSATNDEVLAIVSPPVFAAYTEAKSLINTVIQTLTDEAKKNIQSTGNFTLVNVNEADGVFKGEVTGATAQDGTQQEKYYETVKRTETVKNADGTVMTDQNGNPVTREFSEQVERSRTVYDRTVSLAFSYRIERAKGGTLIGKQDKSHKADDSTKGTNNGPSALKSAASMVMAGTNLSSLKEEVASYQTTETWPLEQLEKELAQDKTLKARFKDADAIKVALIDTTESSTLESIEKEVAKIKGVKERFNAADALVKDSNYSEARTAYGSIYQETGSVAAGYNEAVMVRAQGNLDEAISLMSGLAAKSRKAASDLAQMQNIRSAKEILAKFSGE
jgi:hypothetical protein